RRSAASALRRCAPRRSSRRLAGYVLFPAGHVHKRLLSQRQSGGFAAPGGAPVADYVAERGGRLQRLPLSFQFLS
ncbi:hypothetical protein, partial [Acinetobacter baumannii]|uniref:hypothetical protein n=1 Tax=Acinetobacter baumannii TaxID=470 RepID=UPI00403A2BF4